MSNLSNEMDFEYGIRQFLGDKATHIAGLENNENDFRKELRACIPVIRKRIKEIDTTTRHKERLLNDVEFLKDLLRNKKGGTHKEIIIRLYWLVSRLLGYDFVSGTAYHNLFYWQNIDQFIKQDFEENRKQSLYEYSKKHNNNVISIQKSLYKDLKSKGLSDQVIAGVFNTNEYQIKKLKNDV